jgi:UDP-N-acetyl-D-galactosamine dehydrogenase
MTETKICVVGLGYVGLPLAVEFSKKYNVIGFEISQKKIEALKKGIDSTNEVGNEGVKSCKVEFTTDPKKIKECDFIIVAVPTPVDDHNNPDTSFVRSASEVVGKNMAKGSVVVYESTVWPGCTEEVCLPILEKESGMKLGNFGLGYSPERINPGDKGHRLTSIVKVVSGNDNKTLDKVAEVYSSIITAGIHKASSIKVAEAAKVIENIQRDLNIALMNELSIIFDRMGIDTREVIDAAATKWNFHKYTPGLVGGHCIGVDPYYLTYKAQELGYHPEVILAGRRINDNMHKTVALKVIKALNNAGKVPNKSKILILGLTFKEDVNDSRNSRTRFLIKELKEYGAELVAFDPYLTQEEIDHEGFGVKNLPLDKVGKVDCIIMAAPHKEFVKDGISKFDKFFTGKKIFIDVKGYFDRKEALKNGFIYISL